MNGLDRHITGDYGEDVYQYGDEWYGPLHEEDPDVEPIEELDEDAITTHDFVSFYLYGRLVFTIVPEEDVKTAINRELDRIQFWPDVYFVSDHGNWHRLVY